MSDKIEYGRGVVWRSASINVEGYYLRTVLEQIRDQGFKLADATLIFATFRDGGNKYIHKVCWRASR